MAVAATTGAAVAARNKPVWYKVFAPKNMSCMSSPLVTSHLEIERWHITELGDWSHHYRRQTEPRCTSWKHSSLYDRPSSLILCTQIVPPDHPTTVRPLDAQLRIAREYNEISDHKRKYGSNVCVNTEISLPRTRPADIRNPSFPFTIFCFLRNAPYIMTYETGSAQKLRWQRCIRYARDWSCRCDRGSLVFSTAWTSRFLLAILE